MFLRFCCRTRLHSCNGSNQEARTGRGGGQANRCCQRLDEDRLKDILHTIFSVSNTSCNKYELLNTS